MGGRLVHVCVRLYGYGLAFEYNVTKMRMIECLDTGMDKEAHACMFE